MLNTTRVKLKIGLELTDIRKLISCEDWSNNQLILSNGGDRSPDHQGQLGEEEEADQVRVHREVGLFHSSLRPQV